MNQYITAITGPLQFMATNGVGWGKGETLAEASANCKRSTRRKAERFYVQPAGTVIDGLTITYPAGAKFTSTEL